MIGWLIFWSIVAVYWAIGIKRLPVYFRRVYEYDQDQWGSIHDESDSQKAAAWGGLGLAAVWPYYEGGRWIRNHIIHTMTVEQRQQKEYEQAEKIVAEYTRKKDREEREAFDREMGDTK